MKFCYRGLVYTAATATATALNTVTVVLASTPHHGPCPCPCPIFTYPLYLFSRGSHGRSHPCRCCIQAKSGLHFDDQPFPCTVRVHSEGNIKQACQRAIGSPNGEFGRRRRCEERKAVSQISIPASLSVNGLHTQPTAVANFDSANKGS